MATYQIFKETALPGTLQPHSIYLIAPTGSPSFVEMYVTGTSASTVKRIIDAAQVQSMIDASVASAGATVIVDNITARDALTPTGDATVLVIDASADTTVASGAATYVYRYSTLTWIKISEAESMDVTLAWASITGKPSSSVAAIDAAVSASHSHSNLTQLNSIGQDANGNLTYAGALPVIGWSSVGW